MLYTIPLRVSKNKMYVQVYVTIGLDPTPVFVSELECQEVQFRILPLDGRVSDKVDLVPGSLTLIKMYSS